MTQNEKKIIRLWLQFKANPDSPYAASLLKQITAIDRKAQ